MSHKGKKETTYEVEKILDSKRIGGKKQYLVAWKDYPISEATWEPLENLKNAKEAIKNYETNKFNEETKKEFKPRIRSIVGHQKKNGKIVYSLVSQKDEIIEMSEAEARKQYPQLLIKYLTDVVFESEKKKE